MKIENKKEYKIIHKIISNTRGSGWDGSDNYNDDVITNHGTVIAKQFGKFLYGKIPYEHLPIIKLRINKSNFNEIIIDKKTALKVKKFWVENRNVFPDYFDRYFKRNYIEPIDLSEYYIFNLYYNDHLLFFPSGLKNNYKFNDVVVCLNNNDFRNIINNDMIVPIEDKEKETVYIETKDYKLNLDYKKK